MKVPFVQFGLSYKKIRPQILKEVDRVLSAGDLILRKDVEKFEESLAKYTNCKYAVGVNSGTDAIFLSLKALGIGPGDEVITSGYTFWATAEAIIQTGAEPILAEIDDNLLIDPDDIKKKITKKTKAIIPVHIGGAVCNMDKITAIAAEYRLFVIEDSAQGLGADYEGKKVGSIGTIGCFSFYPAKVLGCYGDGGAITTDNKIFADKVRLLGNHGGKPYPSCVGYNSRLDNLQAAILNVRFKGIKKLINRRIEIAGIYYRDLFCLEDSGNIVLPRSQTYQEYNLNVLCKKERDGLYEFLKKNGIETLKGDYTFPIEQPKTAKEANDSIIRLPIWPDLSNKQIEYAAKKINEYYSN